MKFSINKHIFNYITSSPNYIKTKTITLIYRSYNNDCLGFIVPKQLGPANKRNCFKRQCRGEFHKIYSDNNIKSIGVVVKPKSININYHEISNIFKKLSSRLLKN